MTNSTRTRPRCATTVARRGRPPDLEKRRAILDAATRIFLARGFAGTSMDAVAEEAGVSKITVYANFSGKETLFSAMIRARCEWYNRPERFAEYVDLPPRRALTEMGRNFLALLLDPEVVRLYRVIIGEAESRPQVSRLFYEAGPERAIALFTDYFRRATARGHFAIDDPAQAADDFLALLKGKLHFRATLGLRPRARRTEIEAHVAHSVDLALRAFGTRDRPMRARGDRASARRRR